MQSKIVTIHNNLQSKPAVWFFWFCVLHLILWTLIPVLSYQNLPNDAIEGLAWGRLWLWGYVKHPPLAAWLAAFVTDLVGTVGWPIYLLSQTAIVTAFWATWQLANKLLKPWHALIVVVLFEGVIYYTVESINFNPNVLMLPLWALATLTFYNALTTQKLSQWCFVGGFIALAMLTKYESILLCFAMLIVLLATQRGRESFKKIGFYVALLIAILIFLPNLIYLVQHNFDAIRYATGELDNKLMVRVPFIIQWFLHPIYFLLEQLGAIIGIFILSIPFYRQAKKCMDIDRFDRQFLLIMGFFPFIFTLLLSLIFNTKLVARWGFPFFSLVGIVWIGWLQPLVTKSRMRAFAAMVIGVMMLFIAGEFSYFTYLPYVKGKANHAEYFPGKAIANSVTQQWHQLYHSDLPYAVGDYYTVINIAVYSPDRPVPYLDANAIKSPWIQEANIRTKGAVFVIKFKDDRLTKDLIAALKTRYPNIQQASVQVFPYLTSANTRPLKLWIGFLPPNSKS